ncbi:aromatic amino acid ammonia-lyase [Actinomadura livida]|uniref:Aromatic amino acid ammonia-lyase n=1 Tax=Actinomadura livida TaxID=79909 RepID=A0A7W7MZP4_9ACTN|nr:MULTISPECIES: aromatic amino acid ammonia-lyase [Actinomadura]MBB4777053.1 histidine ammonia-lyase [Actinomadura catellatispora]GGU36980.1 histidine ammonia-lyase [Actinomadura livida]
MENSRIVIDGTSLTCARVRRAAREDVTIVTAPEGVARARRAWEVAGEVAASQPVYGRTTGVGANRVVDVEWEDADAHGLRLLRSHAAGAGPLLAPEIVRAMLTIRLNQIAAGGSGVEPGVLQALADALNLGLLPPVPVYGAIGTGDLTALASTALCLLGERAWLPDPDGTVRRGPGYRLRSADALAFISSNAATLGEAALAVADLRELLRASTVAAALSHFAVRGSEEPYAQAVQDACPHPGQGEAAAAMRALLAFDRPAPMRIQDPYGYRAFPQVHGPALEAAGYAEEVVTREINAAAENPLVDVEGRAVWHGGNFHTAYVGLALDSARAALFQTMALAAARLGTLAEPAFTGLYPFQGATEASSGIMILEYVAHSCLADVRRLATPAALGSAVLSRGVEEHAGFSTQSARATTDAVAAYRLGLGCELLAAVRALRMQGRAPSGGPLRSAFDMAGAVLDPRVEDRPLDTDIAAAADLLPGLARLHP